MFRNKFLISATFFILLIVGFWIAPSPIEPDFFSPDPPKDWESLRPNEKLKQAEIIGKEEVRGPESIAIGEDGLLYTGTEDGWIVKIYPDGTVEKFVKTGGRPLGLKFYPESNDLIVCDAYKGLLHIDARGNMGVLTDSADGIPFKFTDDLDIAQDGTIYFTDASYKFTQKEYLYDLLESKPHGRLLMYDPVSQTTTTLIKDMYFANGVALSSDESFLLVNETYRYRIIRYYLSGDKKGTWDVYVDNLPGFPDNITSNRNGKFYVALYTVRNPALDFLHKNPSLNKLVAKLPKFLWPRPKSYGFIAVLDEEQNFINSFQDTEGANLRLLTSALEHEGFLYLGSLHERQIGKFKLNE
jgi:sugar lactone lactonase YvrE